MGFSLSHFSLVYIFMNHSFLYIENSSSCYLLNIFFQNFLSGNILKKTTEAVMFKAFCPCIQINAIFTTLATVNTCLVEYVLGTGKFVYSSETTILHFKIWVSTFQTVPRGGRGIC